MTNYFLRVKRNGVWGPVELERLTREERASLMREWHREEFLRVIDALCVVVAWAGDNLVKPESKAAPLPEPPASPPEART